MSAPLGSEIPNASSKASRPTAMATPSPRPMIEASSPMTSASSITDRKTCPRLAPTIRKRASSLVRWPTVMEKVFKMVKPPTNSEIRAKTSRAVEKKPSALLIALDCSSATFCAGTTSTPVGSTLAMECSTVALSAPGAIATSMESTRPST